VSGRTCFKTFDEARRIIHDWMQWYNLGRSQGYRSPVQYRAEQSIQVA